MLSIKNLTHSYNSDTQISYADWEVQENNHSLILGDSGSGKTTLLHLIGGLMKPKTGAISIDGIDLAQLTQTALDRFRGLNIGIVFQRPHLIHSLTVLENLTLRQYLGKKNIEKKESIEMLRQLDVLNIRDRKIHQISHGQAQRVSIARALLNRPKLLLADEPTSSLDDQNCEKVIELLKKEAELCESTLIVATHDHRIKHEFKNTLEL